MTSKVQENKKISEDRFKAVKNSYYKSFLWSVIWVLLGIGIAGLMNRYFPLNASAIKFAQAFSIIIAGTALGARGWESQSWNNNGPEALDNNLFKFFSFIGLLTSAWAFSLEAPM